MHGFKEPMTLAHAQLRYDVCCCCVSLCAQALPASLGKLFQLRTLKASKNKLTRLPSDFTNLQALQEVQFSDNSFQLTDPGQKLDSTNPVQCLQVRIRTHGALTVG